MGTHYHSCSRCGRIHPDGYKCSVGRTYRGGEERKLRARYVWALKAQDIKDRSHYLCAVCKDRGIITTEDLSVHHIEKLAERADLFLEDENLICLCSEHHRQADSGKLDKDYLRQLAQVRDHGRAD